MPGISTDAFTTIMDAIGDLVGVFVTIIAIFFEIFWDNLFVAIFLEQAAISIFTMVFAFILWAFYTKYVQAAI